LWQLDSASELIFVGDAGTTEASRPSRRYGVEWTNLYKLHRHWLLDLDWAWSHARFKDHSEAGNFIPGAVQATANLGMTYAPASPWSAALRVRYFGPRPLIEDNSLQSAASWVSNARVSYQVNSRTRLSLDVYNLLGNPTQDIEYLYTSRLRGEALAVQDRHLHPAEPRTARLTLSYRLD
jgi:outer membrane receptor protein involved in Fe transport